MYATVAAVGLFTTAMIPEVQVAATNVASYFSIAVKNDEVVNEGTYDRNGVKQDMMKNGQFISIDEKITAQGITVHLKELYITDSRISVHYRMKKVHGSLIPYEFDSTGLNLKSDGKINGQQEENPQYHEKDGSFSQLSFIQGESVLPLKLKVAGQELEHVGIHDKDQPDSVLTFVEGSEGKDSFQ